MGFLADSRRLGGLFLLLGAASMPFIIGEYLMITSGAPPVSDLAARMAHSQANITALARGWQFEVIAMALIGAGALTRLGTAAAAGWALAAIGVAAVLPMYPMMIGGYASAFAIGPGGEMVYSLVNGFSSEVFYVGNLLVCAGLGLAMAQEATVRVWNGPVWIVWTAAVANGLAALGFLALHAGLPVSLAMVGPFGLAGFISVALFGAIAAFGRQPG